MSDARVLGRDAAKAELADRVFDVFIERGFGAVTADDAARAVGISRATFFRYFGSKEEAVVAAIRRPGTEVPELIRSLPLPEDRSAWRLLRAAHEHVAVHADANRARLVARMRMVMVEPSLRMHFAASKYQRDAEIAEALAERLAEPSAASAVATAGLALVDLTWRTWAERERASFGELLDDALRALEPASAMLRVGA